MLNLYWQRCCFTWLSLVSYLLSLNTHRFIHHNNDGFAPFDTWLLPCWLELGRRIWRQEFTIVLSMLSFLERCHKTIGFALGHERNLSFLTKNNLKTQLWACHVIMDRTTIVQSLTSYLDKDTYTFRDKCRGTVASVYL